MLVPSLSWQKSIRYIYICIKWTHKSILLFLACHGLRTVVVTGDAVVVEIDVVDRGVVEVVLCAVQQCDHPSSSISTYNSISSSTSSSIYSRMIEWQNGRVPCGDTGSSGSSRGGSSSGSSGSGSGGGSSDSGGDGGGGSRGAAGRKAGKLVS
jgi:hypothetical protein